MIPMTLVQTISDAPDVPRHQPAGDQLQDHDAEAAEEGQEVGDHADGQAVHAADSPR